MSCSLLERMAQTEGLEEAEVALVASQRWFRSCRAATSRRSNTCLHRALRTDLENCSQWVTVAVGVGVGNRLKAQSLEAAIDRWNTYRRRATRTDRYPDSPSVNCRSGRRR